MEMINVEELLPEQIEIGKNTQIEVLSNIIEDIKQNGELEGLIVMPFRKGAEKGHTLFFLKDEVLPDAAQSLMNCVYVLIKKDS